MAAGAGSGRMLQEYLVSLGVQVDQRGMRKMQSALTMTKASVIGITGALAAMVTGIVKASASLTNTAQKYEDMARSGKKAVDVVARQEMALKAMGKTLDEVNKNDRLKRIYEDLQGIGSELSMPAAEEGRRALDGLGLEMSRMKMTAMYAFQWINHHFLNKLAGPMSNLRKQLEEMRKNVILNMPKITQVVGNGLAYFMQLMMAGAQGVKDLAGWIASLPNVVLQALGAFAGLWAVMKASPVFWILSGLTSLLMLLDDFQVYKAGGKSAFSGLWEGLEDGTFGDKLGEMLDEGVAKLEERVIKFTEIGSTITKGLVDAILGHDFEADGSTAGTFLNNLVTAIGNILTNPALPDIFGNVVEAAGGLIGGLLTAFAAAMGQIDFNKAGGDIATFVQGFITRITEAITKVAAGGGKNGGVLGGAFNAFSSLAMGIIDALGGVFENVEIGAITSSIVKMIKNIFTRITDLITDADAVATGEKIGTAIGNGVKFVGNFLIQLADDILAMVADPEVATKLGEVGKAIADLIVAGLGSITDIIIEWITGIDVDRVRTESKQKKEAGAGVGYVDGKQLTAQEMAALQALNPEAAAAAANSSEAMDWAAKTAKINEMYGLEFFDSYSPTDPAQLRNRNLPNAFLGWFGLGQQKEKALYGKYERDMWIASQLGDENLYARGAFGAASITRGREEGKVGAELEKYVEAALAKFDQKLVEQGVDIEASLANAEEAAAEGKRTIESIFTTNPVEIPVVIKPPTNREDHMFNFGGPQASGGRFNRFSHVTVSEDGQTEYIIPMNKPERAKGLILQALAEMGTGARGILQSFGMSGDHGIGSAGISAGIESRLAMVGAYPSGGSSSMKANSDNVFNSNPTIYVYSNDPVIAGQTAAKETDRVLMKHIRGPYG